MSYILWYLWHGLLLVMALGSHSLLWLLLVLLRLGLLGRLGLNHLISAAAGPGAAWRADYILGQHTLLKWYSSCRNTVKTRWQYIVDGLRKSIINKAVTMQKDEDPKIFTWLFNTLALGDDSELQKFAASIPRDSIPHLISVVGAENMAFREALLVLLQSCTASTHMAGPNEDVQHCSLLVCMDTIFCLCKASDIPDLDLFRANFTNITIM
jgi:hypothetical protein